MGTKREEYPLHFKAKEASNWYGKTLIIIRFLVRYLNCLGKEVMCQEFMSYKMLTLKKKDTDALLSTCRIQGIWFQPFLRHEIQTSSVEGHLLKGGGKHSFTFWRSQD